MPKMFIILVLSAIMRLSFGQDYAPSRLIVKPHGQSVDVHGMRVIRDLGMNRLLVELPDGMSVQEGMLALEPEVEWAEPDYSWEIDAIPTDPLYGSQWHHSKIQSPDAWDIETGDPGVIIAVVDTGVDFQSPDIGAKWIGGIDSFNDSANAYPGTGWDTHYHGSHVAGIAAGQPSNGYSGAGICWGCSIRSAKFFNSCGSGGLTSDAIVAIDNAVANGARILNNSWGGGSFSQALLDSINAACDAGVLFVASSGNNGRDTDLLPHYPSSYDAPCIISVGNSTSTDALNSSSNYGSLSVDLLAPGTGIMSLPGPPQGSQSQKPHSLTGASRTGTSMSAPMVSGVAGLLYSQHPEWTWVEVKQAILSSVDIIPAAAQTVSGGRLNAARALGWTPPPAPVCGDGVCNGQETCATCAGDCGACPEFCGDGTCDPGEYCGSGRKIGSPVPCSQDCWRRTGKNKACCGNGIVEPGESEMCPQNP